MPISFEVIDSEIIDDIKIITPSAFNEKRGKIWTSYHSDFIPNLLPKDLYFKHDKFSQSKKNVLRGIHGDNKSWKLVSCIQGSIMQVVVDMRTSSETYLKSQCFELGDNDSSSILIPPGMGNAFFVNSDIATYHYKLAYNGDYIDADDQFTIAWDDERLNIKWPNMKPILSERDKGI